MPIATTPIVDFDVAVLRDTEVCGITLHYLPTLTATEPVATQTFAVDRQALRRLIEHLLTAAEILEGRPHSPVLPPMK